MGATDENARRRVHFIYFPKGIVLAGIMQPKRIVEDLLSFKLLQFITCI